MSFSAGEKVTVYGALAAPATTTTETGLTMTTPVLTIEMIGDVNFNTNYQELKVEHMD